MNCSSVRGAANRVTGDVSADISSQRVGNDERRRGQETGLDLRMNASGKIAIA
jgi:hypothetical protein